MSNIFLNDDEIEALREKYAKDNIYFDVYWMTDDKLRVKVGGNQNVEFMLSPKEFYDMFKDNEYFMMELNEMNKMFEKSSLSSSNKNGELSDTNIAGRKRSR